MDLGPEFCLFCLALRCPQSANDIAQIRGLLSEIEDWRRIVLAARRHRVAARLLAGLEAHGAPSLPTDVAAALRRMSLSDARRALGQVEETGRLYRSFMAAGVNVLVLKGQPLSVQLYGKPRCRRPRDIDLLVDPRQIAAAQALLLRAGYASSRHQRSFSIWMRIGIRICRCLRNLISCSRAAKPRS